jgi:Putative adhesin
MSRHPSRRRWHLTGFVLLVAGTFVPAAVHGQSVNGSFQRTLSVSGRPDIEVGTGSGRIEVGPGRDGQIEIRGEIRASDDWGWKRRNALSPEERVRRIEANPPIEQNGSVIRIGRIDDQELQNGVSISYTLRVPTDSLLRAKTGSGSHRIQGVRGNVHASTGSGSIVAREIGSLSASAGSGSIDVERADGAVRASTGSGKIQATGVSGAITAKTGSGGIDVVQVGSGDVDVSSSSGTVRVRGIRGTLRASTTSGGLHVQGEPSGDWELSAASGGVRIDVPDGSGFTLDATTSSGSIEVGMPVAATSTGRRTLQGTVHGGGSRLRVRTSSGSIDIR